MGIRPHFELVCGIHEYPVNDEGYPARHTSGYPRFDPSYTLPLWEKLEEAVPLPSVAHDIPNAREREAWIEQKLFFNRLVTPEGKARNFYELFYCSAEYGVKGLYGYRIGKALGMEHDDLRYALVSMDEKYQESNFELVPSCAPHEILAYDPVGRALQKLLTVKQTTPERLTKEVYRRVPFHDLMRLKRRLQNGQCYRFFPSYEFEEHARVACYLFQQLGFVVPKRMLRLMLVWEWS